jgi:hypothetical protein
MSEQSIHDNNVYAYAVHCEQRRIVLHTEYRDGRAEEYTDVVFSGVVAHHFESPLSGNILFDITQVEPGHIVQTWSDLFDRQKNHGWPAIEYDKPQELISILVGMGVRGYEIGSSYGLSGWVLATQMNLRQRMAKADPDE